MSKIRARNPLGTPGPVSVTLMRTVPSLPSGTERRPRTVICLSARRVLERVRHDVVEDDLKPAEVPHDGGEARFHIGLKVDDLRVGLTLRPLDEIREERGDRNRFDIEAKLSSLDAREVEELVDRVGQLFDADQGRRNQLPLTWRQQVRRFLEHQQRHSQRREWSLELMRRHRDELRAQLVDAGQIRHVIQEKDRATWLGSGAGDRDHARQ